METSQIKKQVEPTKSKRSYKKRKLSVPKLSEGELAKAAGLCNDFGKEHRFDPVDLHAARMKNYRKRTGTQGDVQDAWKRIKDRWLNEEQERQRVPKITKYFSITMQKHSREELLAKLLEEGEALAPPTEEALAPDEAPAVANL